jgi:GNAT superfamily N-acetyltransferase
MTLVVRLGGKEDLEVCEEHMRRVLDEDLRGYHQRWHHDVDDLAGTYLDRPGCALFVAELDGEFTGTTTVTPGGPASPPSPAWLSSRYAAQQTGQLTRVWIVRERRRRGAGRALVTAAAQWALGPGGYTAVEVYDARPDPWDTVHFELDAARLPELDTALPAGRRQARRFSGGFDERLAGGIGAVAALGVHR